MSVSLEQYSYFLTNSCPSAKTRGLFVLIGGFARFDDLAGLESSETDDSPLLKMVREYNPDREIVFAKIGSTSNPGFFQIGIMSLAGSDKIILSLPPLVEKAVQEFWRNRGEAYTPITMVNN